MTFGIILLCVLMLLTAVVLFTGMFAMAKGGEFNKKYGNRLMQWRVWCQGAAIVLVAILFMVKH
jgi:hypothetical protein